MTEPCVDASLNYMYIHGWGVGPEGAKCKFMREYLGPAITVHSFNWHSPSYADTTITTALQTLVGNMEALGGKKRWNVVGSSVGGYLAALLVQQRPDLVNRVILLAPSFDNLAGWTGAMLQENPDWGDGEHQLDACEVEPPKGPYNNTGDKSGGVRFQFIKDLRQYPPYPQIACPTVVVHAVDDQEVDVDFSLNFVRLHSRRGLPVEAHFLPNVRESQKIDHGLYHFAKTDAETFPTFKQVLLKHFAK